MRTNIFPHTHLSVLSLATALLAGASTSLAFAPYQYWPFFPIALLFSLWQSQKLNTKHSFIYWLTFGFGTFAFGISWVHVSIDTFGGMPLVVSMALMGLLALYLAIYPAITGYLLNRIIPFDKINSTFYLCLKYLALFPALWVLTEWMRGWVMTGFPWLWAGYSQTNGPFSQVASLIGALGISYLIALWAGAMFIAIQHHGRKQRLLPVALVTIFIVLLSYLSPMLNPITPTDKSVKVALVQGNIPQSMKWQPEELWPTMVKFMDLSRAQFDDSNSVDIFIWPEAAIPAPESMVEDFLQNANQVANLNDTAIITGIISHQQKAFYNSLIVLGNHSSKQQSQADYLGDGTNEFKKHHLLPIGEFVPLEALLRPLAPFFNLPMSSFTRGDFVQPNLSAVGYSISPAICYEIVFPEQVRANTHKDTDFILTVSNDAWFGTSNGPLQHMEIAQMRAIEMGKPVVRSTNNGVTAIVDPFGKITAKLPQFETAVLVENVQLYQGTTWFKVIGQTPLLLLCAFLLCLSVLIRIKDNHLEQNVAKHE